MSKDNGGPAFPTMKQKPLPGGGVLNDVDGGMTLRDYFEAKAMQGLLSNPSMIDTADIASLKWIAFRAREVADAMLEARK